MGLAELGAEEDCVRCASTVVRRRALEQDWDCSQSVHPCTPDIPLANERQDSEVVLDVEVLEVTRREEEKLGLTFGQEIRAGFFPPRHHGL